VGRVKLSASRDGASVEEDGGDAPPAGAGR
jgi:hypothetical protein